MSNIFANLKEKAAAAEQATDRVGGGFSALNTDIYVGDLKVAYVGQSSGGANFLQVIIENVRNAETGAPASDYRETLYFTSGKDKGQSPTYEKNGKQYFLPGFTVASDLLMMTAGTDITDAVFEEKIVNIYDFEQKKELPKSVMVAVDAVGNPVAFAVYKNIEDKNVKDSAGNYVASGETRETNNIEKVFHAELHVTVIEAEEAVKAEQEPSAEHAVFWPAWLEQHQGKSRDKTNKAGGAPGKPGVPPTTGAGAAGAGAAKKSLFGKK